MWHDTIQFVRCAKQAFELPPPVHEYGLSEVGAPLFVAPLSDSSEPKPASGPSQGSPGLYPLDDLAQLPCRDGCAGTVACLNVLQHVTDPKAVADEMIRLLAPGGILLVCSCTAGCRSAGAEVLWRPAPHAFHKLLAPLEATLIGWQGREGDPHGIYAIGCRAPVTPQYLAGANRFLRSFRQTLARRQRAIPWSVKVREWLARLAGRPTSGRARKDHYHSQFVMHAPVDGRFPHELLADCLHLDEIGARFDLTQ